MNGRIIVLRDWWLEDLEPWNRWLEPGHRWQELDAPYYPPLSIEQRDDLIERKRTEIEEGAAGSPPNSLVIADRRTDAFMGLVTWYWQSEDTNWPGVGIAIFDPERWGRGAGYEALGLWSDFLFRSLSQIVRLDLRTWSGNRGMMRLAEKLGYRQEARFRQARIVAGEFYDGLGYGVLRDEWEQRYPKGFMLPTRF